MGLVTLRLLRDDHKDASWLSDRERTALAEALAEEQASRPRKNFLVAIRDIKVALLTGILFSYSIGINAIAIWLPLIFSMLRAAPTCMT